MLATASTCFADPAVTAARTLSDTFTGIRPLDALAFVPAEFAGALLATGLAAWLFGGAADPDAIVVPHTPEVTRA